MTDQNPTPTTKTDPLPTTRSEPEIVYRWQAKHRQRCELTKHHDRATKPEALEHR